MAAPREPDPMVYPNPAFREERVEVLHAAIRELAFGLLVTRAEPDFLTSYLPFELDAGRGPLGTLVGHVARYNPHWKEAVDGTHALAVFQGPHAYVSPSWYPGMRDDPRQVPTWDYLAVEARGALTTFDDEARLLELVTRLTDRHESGRPDRWHVTDAPGDYVRAELHRVVGLELRIEKLIGRYKLSQNRSTADREGARAGLSAAASERERAVGRAIGTSGPKRPRSPATRGRNRRG
jgi:transcriptional regulator